MANIPRLRAQRNMECLETAISCVILAIYHKPHYKLVTNVIRAVKINVSSYPWSTVYIPRLPANQQSGLEPPSL
jgi:hypothetical protein